MNNLDDFVQQARKNERAVQAALDNHLEPLIAHLQDKFPEAALSRQDVEQIAASAALDAPPYTPPAPQEKKSGSKIIYLVPPDAVYKPEQLIASLNVEVRIATPAEVKPQPYRQLVQGRAEEVASQGARGLLRPVPECKRPKCRWFAMTGDRISEYRLCALHRAVLRARDSIKKRMGDLTKLEDELRHCMHDEESWKWWYVLHSDLANKNINKVLALSEFMQDTLQPDDPRNRSTGWLIERMRRGVLTELKGIGPERLQQVSESVEAWIRSLDVPPLTPSLLEQIVSKFEVDWVKPRCS